MRTSISILIKVALFASLFIYFSCKKETDNKPNPNPIDTTKNPIDSTKHTSRDSLRMDSIFNVVEQMVKEDCQIDNEIEDIAGMQDEIMIKGGINFGRIAADTIRFKYESCADVKVVPKTTTSSGLVIVDFGSGCRSQNDQRIRKGIVRWTYTQKLHEKGAVLETRFVNYKVKRNSNYDSAIFENSCAITTTNLDTNSTGFILKRDILLDISYGDGSSFSTQGTQNLAVSLGEIAFKWDNTSILKQGSSLSGKDRKGKTFTKTATTDIVRKGDCAIAGKFRPFSGIMTYQEAATIRTVNFGTGSCVGDVITTMNGKTKKSFW